MKTASSIAKLQEDNVLVHYYTSNKGCIEINPPVWAKDFSCPFCGGDEYTLWKHDIEKTIWFCKRVCLASRLPKQDEVTSNIPKTQRSIEWPLFCDLNGIGDIHHDVKFEYVNQSQEKLDYMLKFATSPRGIILMRGGTGSGKTYAAMGICEYYTRTNKLCIFTTQKLMISNWLISFSDINNTYISQVSNVPLLVIDDFGLNEPNPKFLEFFMELINTRMQWKNRGTIITTNLDSKSFIAFCGGALCNRILTGQIFEFTGKSRRTKNIL